MLAVIDEATPFVGSGVCYCVVSGVLLGDEDYSRDTIRAVIPRDRRRPFHWSQEGPQARQAMIAALTEIGVLARVVAVPCARRRQEAARAVALETTIDQLIDDGCKRLVIETRTPAQDGRDQALILDMLRSRQSPKALAYSWEPKSNELLWVADAIGGAVHEHLTNLRDTWYDKMVAGTGLTLDYGSLPN